MKYKHVILILKIVALLIFVLGIVSPTLGILSIANHPYLKLQSSEFVKDRYPYPILQILIPQILMAIQFFLSSLLFSVVLVCGARYLKFIENQNVKT